ncbi:MAG: Clas87 [Betabaculovirus sp.]|nr:MAG: Clas87 [Betabaculovirus sp.]
MVLVRRRRCLINIMSSQKANRSRVKYDSQLLLKYVFDYKLNDTEGAPNIINVCRVKVKKFGGAALAHYYAQIYLANDFSFEFHPGSQPKTFQNINDTQENVPYMSFVLCEECCRKKIEGYIRGENNFNIAFQNCETILCDRKSVQTVISTVLLVVLLVNIVYFSMINLVFIAFLVYLLYIVNNYIIKEPTVSYCEHYIRDGHVELE